MKTASISQEKMIFGLTALFLGGFMVFFFMLQGNNKKGIASAAHNINYEMAKVKSAEGQYSLEGREVDRENQELETSIADSKKIGSKKADQKADANIKKSAVKNAQKLTAKPAQVAPKATVPTSSTAVQSRSTTEEAEFKVEYDKNNLQSYKKFQIALQNQQQSTLTEVEEKNEKQLKTVDQWIKEILASDDRQIILKLVVAFKNKEVTESDYYSIINQILISSEEIKKGFALYALRASPSYNSYVTLVKAQPNMNSSYQSYIQETLFSYHQLGSLAYLQQALGSSDKVIILKTLEVVKIGLNDIKSGSTARLVDSRYRRDNDFSDFAVKNYQAFLPQLNMLQAQAQQSGDQDVFSAANQLSQTIQSTVVVALN